MAKQLRSAKAMSDVSFQEWHGLNIEAGIGGLLTIDVDQIVAAPRDFENKAGPPQLLILLEAKRVPSDEPMPEDPLKYIRRHHRRPQIRILQSIAKTCAVPAYLVLYQQSDGPLPNRATDSESLAIESFATALIWPQMAKRFTNHTAEEYREWLTKHGKALTRFNALDENRTARHRLNKRRDVLITRMCKAFGIPSDRAWLYPEEFEELEGTKVQRDYIAAESDPVAAGGEYHKREQGCRWSQLPYRKD